MTTSLSGQNGSDHAAAAAAGDSSGFEALAREGCKWRLPGGAGSIEGSCRAVDRTAGDHSSTLATFADRADVERLFAGPINTLGNRHSGQRGGGEQQESADVEHDAPDWDRVLAINASGVYHTMYAVLPQDARAKDGVIINIRRSRANAPRPWGAWPTTPRSLTAPALGISVPMRKPRTTFASPRSIRGSRYAHSGHRPQPVSAERRAKMLLSEDVADMIVAVAKLPPRAHVPS